MLIVFAHLFDHGSLRNFEWRLYGCFKSRSFLSPLIFYGKKKWYISLKGKLKNKRILIVVNNSVKCLMMNRDNCRDKFPLIFHLISSFIFVFFFFLSTFFCFITACLFFLKPPRFLLCFFIILLSSFFFSAHLTNRRAIFNDNKLHQKLTIDDEFLRHYFLHTVIYSSVCYFV